MMNSGADAVVCMFSGSSFAAFARQAKPYGFFEKLHVISGALTGNHERILDMGKECPDGVTLEANHLMDFPDTPENIAWNKLYLDLMGGSYIPGFAMPGYLGSMVLFKGIQKAGTVETEKVIKALEGMAFDSPKQKGATIHPWDHKTDIGELWGVTKYDPNLGHGKLVNVRYISAKGLSHSAEEVKAIREAFEQKRK
jgi:branched-chain amino acid transport system substrate-binding protein